MYDIKLSPEQVANIKIADLKNPVRATADSPERVYELIKHYAEQEKEHFVSLMLDAANKVICIETVSVGTLTGALVHPREVFRTAIKNGAVSIIVAHNHPSGNLHPSDADTQITQRLQDAGELLGIALLDHLIITKEGFVAV